MGNRGFFYFGRDRSNDLRFEKLFPSLTIHHEAGFQSGNDGDTPSVLTDFSGYGYDSATGTPATLKRNIVVGKSVFRFTAGNKYVLGYAPSTPNYTIFIVCNTTNTSGSHRLIGGANNWLIGPYSGYWQNYTGNTFVQGKAVVSGEWVVIALSQSPNSLCFISSGSDELSIKDYIYYGLPGVSMSLVTNTYGETFDGDLAEFIYCNEAITGSNLMYAVNYLKEKYGITIV